MAVSNNFYPCSTLTGGGKGALDKIDGDDLNDGDAALVVTSSYAYLYMLDADSGKDEDSPEIISPDDNAGNKRWIRLNFFASIVSEPESGEHRIKNVRYLANGDLKYIYEGDAEP
jgi:hypothetical protein